MEFAGFAAAPADPRVGTSTPIYGGGGMQGGYGGGGIPAGGMPGQYGTHHSLGSYGQSMVVTANLEHGQPILHNPETGEPLPPGVVPNIRNPNEYYAYTPWEASQEAQMIADAQSAKTMNDALKQAMEPWDEFRAEQIKKGAATKDAAITAGAEKFRGESEKFLKDPQKYLGDASKGLGASLGGALTGSGGSNSNGNKSGGSRPGTSNPNVGKSGNFASDIGYSTGQGIKGIGGTIQGIGKGLTDFGKGIGEGLGFGNPNPDRVTESGKTNRQINQNMLDNFNDITTGRSFDTRGGQGAYDEWRKNAAIDQMFGLTPKQLPTSQVNNIPNSVGSKPFSPTFGGNSGGAATQTNTQTLPDGRPRMRRMEPQIR